MHVQHIVEDDTFITACAKAPTSSGVANQKP